MLTADAAAARVPSRTVSIPCRSRVPGVLRRAVVSSAYRAALTAAKDLNDLPSDPQISAQACFTRRSREHDQPVLSSPRAALPAAGRHAESGGYLKPLQG